MSQRSLRITLAALSLAAALAFIPLPAHAAPTAAEPVSLWTLALQWLESLWNGGLEKSGSAIDPNGNPNPGGGTTSSQTGGESGGMIDPNGGKTGG